MSIPEASTLSGFAPFTLRMFARQDKFKATKPKGRRGGWEIDERSFRAFLRSNEIQRGNQFFQNAAKKGRA